MPWQMGIDEAGYGPNLGPFVMSSALFYLPGEVRQDLWKALQAAVRKANQKADGRLIVDDSKQVYSPKTGLEMLERNLWPFIAQLHPGMHTLQSLWESVVATDRATISHDPCSQWGQILPHSSPTVSSTALLRGTLSSAGIRLQALQTCIVCPRDFNRLTRETDSKAAVPVTCIGQLLAKLPDEETLDITVDRLGGRQRYADLVSRWFPDEDVSIELETPALSRYRAGSRVTISFQVEGDQHSFPVALASMLSKYWREILMKQFNAWFITQQPGVTPTAGYPLDAARFWKAVEPLRQRLGLIDDDWWRER